MIPGIIAWVAIILVVILIVRAVRKNTAKKKEEIISKYGFTAEQITKFMSNKLWEGMPIDALYVVLGEGEQNKTQAGGREHIQHVYKNETDYHYVYTDNGIVTSWQNGKAE